MKSDRDGLPRSDRTDLDYRSEVRIIEPKNGKGDAVFNQLSLALEIARFIIELLRLLT
ncbi:MAG: hypothetical protein IJT54_00425 [Candidatus Methanomethylophilaceae archaeon]|nr:hypothetical protein [Candidatus Methanomethylophilaceae archaeon]